jgi:hypothetical protein
VALAFPDVTALSRRKLLDAPAEERLHHVWYGGAAPRSDPTPICTSDFDDNLGACGLWSRGSLDGERAGLAPTSQVNGPSRRVQHRAEAAAARR